MKILKNQNVRIFNLQALSLELERHAFKSQFECIDNYGRWVNFYSLDNSWSIWFNLQQLSALLVSDLSGMYITNELENYILELINLTTNLSLQDAIIPFSSMVKGKVSDAASINEVLMLKIFKDDFSFFVEKNPLLHKKYNFELTWFEKLHCSCYIQIGYIFVSLRSLMTIEARDILILKHIDLEFITSSKKIYISNWLTDIDMTTLDTGNNHIEQSQDTLILEDISELPVKVDVIIHSCAMTLKELNEILMSKTYHLPVEAHKNISLRINNQLIAYGELITFDDALAVEIKEVLIGKKNDQ